MRKATYWSISVFAVLFLFVLIIGLSAWIIESGINHVTFIAILISLIGLFIILLSLRWPGQLWTMVVKKPGLEESGYGYDVGGSIILGLSLLFGGFLYAYYEHVGAIVVSFGVGVILIRLRIAYLQYKYGGEA